MVSGELYPMPEGGLQLQRDNVALRLRAEAAERQAEHWRLMASQNAGSGDRFRQQRNHVLIERDVARRWAARWKRLAKCATGFHLPEHDDCPQRDNEQGGETMTTDAAKGLQDWADVAEVWHQRALTAERLLVEAKAQLDGVELRLARSQKREGWATRKGLAIEDASRVKHRFRVQRAWDYRRRARLSEAAFLVACNNHEMAKAERDAEREAIRKSLTIEGERDVYREAMQRAEQRQLEAAAEMDEVSAKLRGSQTECVALRSDLAANAKMLARQCDLAREVENGAAAMRGALKQTRAWLTSGGDYKDGEAGSDFLALLSRIAGALAGSAGVAILARLERLGAALRWYADTANYHISDAALLCTVDVEPGDCPIIDDDGERARTALEKEETARMVKVMFVCDRCGRTGEGMEDKLYEAVIWMSGSFDFSPEGQARQGFEKLVLPLLQAYQTRKGDSNRDLTIMEDCSEPAHEALEEVQG